MPASYYKGYARIKADLSDGDYVKPARWHWVQIIGEITFLGIPCLKFCRVTKQGEQIGPANINQEYIHAIRDMEIKDAYMSRKYAELEIGKSEDA